MLWFRYILERVFGISTFFLFESVGTYLAVYFASLKVIDTIFVFAT